MTLSWHTLIAVGLGGFLGAIARAYVVHMTNKHFPIDLPVGILIVNIVGSFIIGCLFAIIAHNMMSDITKSFLVTGFLGALTTYSTFAIESFFLLQSSFLLGITNMFLNLFGTILAAGSGYKLLHFLIK
ncbi:fluoride efflux transporter CrcB [Arcobacter sp. CECT 8989]|uniref:fluoride efflux transporter CrcB n=1 Tax=Arcobacter sp. CECT 8989 TaxID=2044509 RepID=UPI00100BD7F7|nr:fluoride efflux transporter CrcB [Arcobacter sp. CECT 8989]RXK03172.1 fluoride efflux transporter CrcB [Arcobacter sp. CECT 8989]